MSKWLVLSLALVFGLSGWALAEGKMMKKMSAKDRMLGFYRDVINAHNVDAIADYVTDDFVDHNPDPDQKQGLAGLQAAFKGMFMAFPDIQVKVEEVVAQGNMVVARVTMTGTQKGDYMGMKASGRSFSMGGMDMIKLKDGKATDRWGYFDSMAMMAQLSPKKDAMK